MLIARSGQPDSRCAWFRLRPIVPRVIPDGCGSRVTLDIIYVASEIQARDLWQRATTRTFELVNALLAEAGSDEQLYQLSGGNDCRAISGRAPISAPFTS